MVHFVAASCTGATRNRGGVLSVFSDLSYVFRIVISVATTFHTMMHRRVMSHLLRMSTEIFPHDVPDQCFRQVRKYSLVMTTLGVTNLAVFLGSKATELYALGFKKYAEYNLYNSSFTSASPVLGYTVPVIDILFCSVISTMSIWVMGFYICFCKYISGLCTAFHAFVEENVCGRAFIDVASAITATASTSTSTVQSSALCLRQGVTGVLFCFIGPYGVKAGPGLNALMISVLLPQERIMRMMMRVTICVRLTLFAGASLWLLSRVLRSTSYGDHRKQENGKNIDTQAGGVCVTEDCQYMRWLIDISVDNSKEPCDNFYTYVCTGAQKRFSEDFDFMKGGMLNVMSLNMTRNIYRHLRFTVLPKTGQTQFEKAAAFFQHCRNANMRENVNAIVQFLEEHRMSFAKGLNFDPLDVQVEFLVKTDIPLIFHMSSLLLPGMNEFIFAMFQHADFNASKAMQLQERHQRGKRISAILKAVFSATIDESLLASIIDAEDKLIEMSEYPNSATNTQFEFFVSNLGDIMEDSALSRNWMTVLQRHARNGLPGDRRLTMTASDIAFFHSVYGSKMAIPSSDLKIYIAWRTTLYLFSTAGLLHTENVNDIRCLRIVFETFPNVAASTVVSSTLNQTRIASINKIVANIFEEVKDSFYKSSWLDADTRNGALVKLSLLKKRVGYVLDLNSSTAVDAFIKDVPDLNGPFVADLIKVQTAATQSILSNVLNNSVDHILTHRPPMPIYSANAAYTTQLNAIFIPPAIMHRPAFAYGAPPEVNYGALGHVLMHEIMHAYDENGRYFDGFGEGSEWLTWKSSIAYETRVRCHNVSMRWALKGKLLVDYQNEYLADIMGEMSLLNAYKKASRKTAGSLGQVKDLTRDQIFYVSWCLLWCGKKFPDASHPPLDERCNVPLMNSVHFSEVFSCDNRAHMNPALKCPFW
ncbi:neprilysin-1-like [Ornithodoros turicata]|uniref:neprilysin-1-like n=1 Tax=Ornithodoros turicata TaxID=34597 RepID=UPI00313869EC